MISFLYFYEDYIFMKKKTLIIYLQIVGFILILSNFTTMASSHAPYYLDLTYNTDTTTLTATFTHPVSDPNTHYVSIVEIKLNYTILDTFYYTSQPIADEFSYEYNITASEGDELLVTGDCSQGGYLAKFLLIGNSTISETTRNLPGDNGNETDTGIPGYNLSIFLFSSLGILFIIFPIIKKKLKVSAM